MKTLDELKQLRQLTLRVEAWDCDVTLQPVPAMDFLRLREQIESAAAEPDPNANMAYAIELISRSIPAMNSDDGRAFLEGESAEVVLQLMEAATKVNRLVVKKKAN